MTDILGTY